MKATIFLLTEKRATATANVINGIKSAGLVLIKFSRDDYDEDHSYLRLEIESDEMSLEQLTDRLLAMDGAVRVLESEVTESAAPPSKAQVPEKPVIAPDLVDKIVNEYPMVLTHLIQVENSLQPEQQAPYFKRLGEAVGNELRSEHAGLQYLDSASEVLKRGILPILDGIAEGDVAGSELIISKSIFTRTTLKLANERSNSSRCHFLAGMIQGLLAESALSGVSVNETKCIDRGDEFCIFEVKGG